jgi:hypothetical protein
MRVRTFTVAIGLACAAVFIGLAGAGAFNPDDGYVAQVDPLWRLFGIAVYLGALALPVILLTGFVALVLQLCRRWHSRVSGV